MVKQTSKWGQLILLTLIGLGSTGIATAYIYRLDEVITVQGRLVAKQGGVEVKSPVNGQLEQVLINNGENVNKGDILFKFDVRSAKQRENTLKKQIQIENQRLKDQLEGIAQREKTQRRNIALTEKVLSRLNPLEATGAISELQILQQENTLEKQRDELIQLNIKRIELTNESNTRISELEGEVSQIKNRLRNEYVKAPITGTIFEVKPDNDEYVVQNAESLVKIVPKGQLSAVVNVGNKDIGFIKKGQKVKVRIDSFPFTEYGEIDGIISRLSADAMPPDELVSSYHFPVDITLDKSYLDRTDGEVIPLQAGMTISTNMKLRDRRLIELLSDLFTDKKESLKRLRKS